MLVYSPWLVFALWQNHSRAAGSTLQQEHCPLIDEIFTECTLTVSSDKCLESFKLFNNNMMQFKIAITGS